MIKAFSGFLNRAPRSLEQCQFDLVQRFNRLPANHPDRPKLAQMIRRIDDQLDLQNDGRAT